MGDLSYWDTQLVGAWGDSASNEHRTLQILHVERVTQWKWMLYLKQRGYKCVEVYCVHWVSQVHCLCSVCEHHAVFIDEQLC